MIGSGAAGFADGDFATAQFNQPQGMALQGDDLCVADTENHAIRKVDLRGAAGDDRGRHRAAGARAAVGSRGAATRGKWP